MQILAIALTLPKDYRESLQGRNFDTQGQHCENVEKGRYFPFLNEATNFQQEDRVLCRIATNSYDFSVCTGRPGNCMSLGSQTVVADLQVPSSNTIITALPQFYMTTLITIAHFRNFFQHHLSSSAGPQSLLLIIQLSLRTLNHHQLNRTLHVGILLIPFIRKPNLNSILSSPPKLPHNPPLTSLQYR